MLTLVKNKGVKLMNRKYPISKFKELVEPIISKNRKKTGRPTKVSHYNFFCGAY